MNLERVTVFVRRLIVDAEIGVWPHERGRTQHLLIDIALEIAPAPWSHLKQTVNYQTLADHARRIAETGHIGLVEEFATRLAKACLGEPGAQAVKIRVEKPEALAPDAEAAGVEIEMRHG